jgi:Tol biopolymer transport system component
LQAYHNGVGIFVSDLNGHHRRRIVRDGDLPTWSPDDRLIAYRGGTGTQQGNVGFPIYIVSADGGRLHRLRGAVGFTVAWSPNGKTTQVALFCMGSTPQRVSNGVCVIDQRGGHRRQIFTTGAQIWPPLSWLPR